MLNDIFIIDEFLMECFLQLPPDSQLHVRSKFATGAFERIKTEVRRCRSESERLRGKNALSSKSQCRRLAHQLFGVNYEDALRFITLGRAVEEMPTAWTLSHQGDWWYVDAPGQKLVGIKTPLEALQAARKSEKGE